MTWKLYQSIDPEKNENWHISIQNSLICGHPKRQEPPNEVKNRQTKLCTFTFLRYSAIKGNGGADTWHNVDKPWQTQPQVNISCMIPFLGHVHNTNMKTERKMAARG